MKILRISAKGFKNCADGFYMDFIAKSKKPVKIRSTNY